jgi:hypothetical protein
MESATPLRDRCSQWFGQAEYWLRPALARRRGGPFNGQILRQACYGELLSKFRFHAIIETGAYRGITTALFADANIPVFSIEANPRFAAYAKSRLHEHAQVRILLGDSRQRLRDLVQMPACPKQNVFCYLDAHWYDDLPLQEELELILDHWEDPVIMIDDFQVPGTDYAYDAYGPGKNLVASYLDPVRDRGISLFYPRYPASNDTGARRGCVVLGTSTAVATRLKSCQHLVAAETLPAVQVA